jgi:membrane associated rhomboid family serine protease
LIPIRDLNPTRIFPVVTLLIIAVNLAAFFLWQPRDNIDQEATFLYENAAISCELTTGDALTAAEIRSGVCDEHDAGVPAEFPDKNIWLAGFVSMFLHGSVIHILGNMWFLWIFGNNVEEAYGSFGFLAMYLASGIVATATFVLANPTSTDPLIGASGAIAGVLGAYLVLFPTHRVLTLLLFFFVQVPAVLFLGLWFFSQFGMADASVAWQAHVGGFAFGVLLTLPLRTFLLRRVATLHSTRPRYVAY